MWVIRKNYVEFNKRKVYQELNRQAHAYGVEMPIVISYGKEGMKVEDDSPEGRALQKYLDRDKNLNNLMQQTSKLSQFYEWGQIKQQAAEYQDRQAEKRDIIDFLKASRIDIMQENQYYLSKADLKLDSQGKAESLIQHYNEKFGMKNQT